MYVQCSIEGTIISAPSTIARSSSRTGPKGEVIPALQRNDADDDDDDPVTGNLQLSVWDMPGSEAYGSLRSLSYPSADVFALCIALDHHATIDMREAGEVFDKVRARTSIVWHSIWLIFSRSGLKK
jgi:GTPase SAR1 family protein